MARDNRQGAYLAPAAIITTELFGLAMTYRRHRVHQHGLCCLEETTRITFFFFATSLRLCSQTPSTATQ